MCNSAYRFEIVANYIPDSSNSATETPDSTLARSSSDSAYSPKKETHHMVVGDRLTHPSANRLMWGSELMTIHPNVQSTHYMTQVIHRIRAADHLTASLL
ncbi:uncharacterized protein BDZ99DRAFT_461149 [Mytilinidion resinicola]|uniref:Uncharacterized protein n=1 Tax=Mytilinidion resinicola TaxID=574789 RepID=A0A6A6YVB3_9PEZI|nr:uncharacterized protein BDZ99DRAFT_461149 [Mytilinidion resinicola]KAF2812459.1 hypothetical protein BDZ99DRAFT_461149 [Mytilinidion resinicola]